MAKALCTVEDRLPNKHKVDVLVVFNELIHIQGECGVYFRVRMPSPTMCLPFWNDELSVEPLTYVDDEKTYIVAVFRILHVRFYAT